MVTISAADIVVCVVVATLFLAVVVSGILRRLRAKKTGGCPGGCTYCHGCAACSSGYTDEKKGIPKHKVML